MGKQLGMILGAAAVVLLIACGNVAGLLLARAADRESEMAVRAALGASLRALVRLLFSQASCSRWSAASAEWPSPSWALGFAVGASAFTTLVFGMVPALLAARSNPTASVAAFYDQVLERVRAIPPWSW